MRALTIFFGALLLLPGVCSIVAMFALLPGGHLASDDWPFLLLWAVCLGVSGGGAVMLRNGFRK